jgi:hypothetical protein
LASGCETGIVLFFEVAQQVLFAQQCGLQPSGLGAFERMHEAAGSWSGRTAIASTTANRIGAVLRITQKLAHESPGSSDGNLQILSLKQKARRGEAGGLSLLS